MTAIMLRAVAVLVLVFGLSVSLAAAEDCTSRTPNQKTDAIAM